MRDRESDLEPVGLRVEELPARDASRILRSGVGGLAVLGGRRLAPVSWKVGMIRTVACFVRVVRSGVRHESVSVVSLVMGLRKA